MNGIGTYCIEVLVSSGVLLAAYALLLERRVSFRWCRFYLVGAMIAAALIPALRIPVWPGEVIEVVPFVASDPVGEWTPLLGEPAANAPANTLRIAGWCCYALGVALVLGLLLRQLVRMYRLRRGAEITRGEHFTLVRTLPRIASFSFFRSIYIWIRTPEEELPAIVAHESSHIAHRHSIERIAMECLRALMWWNPVVWIAARRLTEVEEFEADRDVLESGYDLPHYLDTVFRQLFGYTPRIASGIRDSLTKKRFRMMTSPQRSRRPLLRLAATLPAVIGLLCAFGFTSQPDVVRIAEKPTPTEAEAVQPALRPRTEPAAPPSSPTEPRPAAADTTGLAERSLAPQSAPEASEAPVPSVESPASAADTPETPAAPLQDTLAARRVLFSGHGKSAAQRRLSALMADPRTRPLYIIDGVECANPDSVDPASIDQISVSRDGSYIDRYGERARNGVVIITTKPRHSSARSDRRKPGAPATESPAAIGTPPAVQSDSTVIVHFSDKSTESEESGKELPFAVAEVMPLFQGSGLAAFRQWVAEQIVYPEEALKQKIEGRVVLQFIVETDGSVSNVKLLQSPHRLLSEEAIRIVTSSPAWTPGEQRGHKVRVLYTLPVDFHIGQRVPQTPQPPDKPAPPVPKSATERTASGEAPEQMPAAGGVPRGTIRNASEKQRIVPRAEVMPRFGTGDIPAFRKWVMERLKYPVEALEKGIQGRVVLEFVVERDGSVDNIRTLQTCDRQLAAEAVRVVASSPAWTPGKDKGEHVRVRMTIPIDFRIRSGNEASPSRTIVQTGRVTDTDGKPVAGATVTMPGSDRGVVTDPQGRFRIELPEGSMLEIGYIDCRSQRIRADGKPIGVMLIREAPGNAEEVIVSAFGTSGS